MRLFSGWLDPRYLVVSGALILVATGVIVNRVHRTFPVDESKLPNFQNGSATKLLVERASMLRNPYVWTMLGISAATTVASLFIDFQFYEAATLTGNNNIRFSKISTSI